MNPQPQDPLDTLRNDIAQAIRDSVDQWVGPDVLIRREVEANADAALEVLTDAASDPVRLRAILELVGLEWQESTVASFVDEYDGETMACLVSPPFADDVSVLVCRVRPQGEE